MTKPTDLKTDFAGFTDLCEFKAIYIEAVYKSLAVDKLLASLGDPSGESEGVLRSVVVVDSLGASEGPSMLTLEALELSRSIADRAEGLDIPKAEPVVVGEPWKPIGLSLPRSSDEVVVVKLGDKKG